MLKHAGIILKTVEVCNINCDYCYFFYGGDESFKFHPPYINRDTVSQLSVFLSQACNDLKIDLLTVEFHGGEPLMQKKVDFDFMCQQIKSALPERTTLEFVLQTNGMLIDNDWVDLFCKYEVGVGISIDGPKQYNDIHRLDKRGRGTYNRVAEKINFINHHKDYLKVYNGVGLLCVIDPDHDAETIYYHFTRELKCHTIDFLLPDNAYHNPPKHNTIEYGRYFCRLFNAWVKDDNPDIDIRFLGSTLQSLMGGVSRIYGTGLSAQNSLPFITVSSAGDLAPLDNLRVVSPQFSYSKYNIYNSTMKDFLKLPVFIEIARATQQLPSVCMSCCWKKICCGGAIDNRYSEENSLNNPSIYCDALKMVYAHLSYYLISNGYKKEKILSNIGISNNDLLISEQQNAVT